MSPLMRSISGVRGIVGESFSPEAIIHLGRAFGTYIEGGRVVVGRDTRTSGEMVKHALLSGLLASGCPIVDLGVVATPTASLMIGECGAAGGIVISASHNPVEWNALKFFRADGIYLNPEQSAELFRVCDEGPFRSVRWDGIREVEQDRRGDGIHLRRALGLVDVEAIRKARFHVALDCCNGAGVGVTLRLLEDLGARVERIHCTPDGLFPHDPEPNFENLGGLCELVGETGCDAGFAQDPDADRLALVDERGEFVGEEYTLALAVDHVLARRRGTVVTNVSTTQALERIAERYGVAVERTPVGEVYVAERMKKIGSPVGGEGNGGVIDPRLHYGRDSLAAIVLTLEALALSRRKLSELVARLPQYAIEKHRLELDEEARAGLAERLDRLAAKPPAGWRVDRTDGLKLIRGEEWIHLRASNTEPILRIIAETPERGRTGELVREYAEKFSQST